MLPHVNRVLVIVGLVGFATALFTRAVDPLVPQMAVDFGLSAETVALLSTAFALPFAVVQPILGPIADMFGKTRLMILSLAVLIAATLVGAVATDFRLLFATRIVAGIAAGGVFPVGLAVVGDLVPVAERQVALGRLTATFITGNLLGASLAGVGGDLYGWRAVFLGFSGCGGLVLAAAVLGLSGRTTAPAVAFDRRAVWAGYRGIFANPNAKVCFAAVFLEGVAVFGLFPFVALLLHAAGEERAAIAGLVLAGFSIGGVLYSFVVPALLARLSQGTIMILGGTIGATGLAAGAFDLPWQAELADFVVLGFGFYMLHGCVQVRATELSTTARGAAMSLHSSAFFLGQASGPLFYGAGLAAVGAAPTLVAGAAVILMVGFGTAWFFTRPVSA